MVNILLDELDTHVWKAGNIVDVGKHNDTVMAFAHAIDQMTHADSNALPMATQTANNTSWGNSKSSGSGRFIIFGN
jgi:hypothetical protein